MTSCSMAALPAAAWHTSSCTARKRGMSAGAMDRLEQAVVTMLARCITRRSLVRPSRRTSSARRRRGSASRGAARTSRRACTGHASCHWGRKASWHCAAVCRRQPCLLRLPERQAGIRNILLCTIKAQSALQQHHCRDRPIEGTAVASSPLEADPPSCKTAGQSCVGGAGTLCEQQYLLGRLQRKGSHPPG